METVIVPGLITRSVAGILVERAGGGVGTVMVCGLAPFPLALVDRVVSLTPETDMFESAVSSAWSVAVVFKAVRFGELGSPPISLKKVWLVFHGTPHPDCLSVELRVPVVPGDRV